MAHDRPQAPRYKRPESVLVVVTTLTYKTLLLKRIDHACFWQSITGSLEWNDTSPARAAARELHEETGILVAPELLRDWQLTQRYEILPEFRYRYEPGVTHNSEQFFSLELPGACEIRLSPREHLEHEWVDLDAAIERVFSWTNRVALERIAAAVKLPAH